jgi:DNA-binding NarL/FixJ family response regulator
LAGFNGGWGAIIGGIVVRILLADDHQIVRRGLRSLLEMQSDFAVCAEAADGREAVALALEHKPDVAIVGISLPVLNGIEATRQIREGSPTTEVLIFTIQQDEDLIAEMLRAGARGYLLAGDPDKQIVDSVAMLALHPSFSERAADMLLRRLDKESHAPVLTAREKEIVQRIAEGQSNKAIAGSLNLSIKTIESHRAAAMRKLGTHSTAGVIRYAIRHRLVEL